MGLKVSDRQVFMIKSAEEELLIQIKDILEKETDAVKGNIPSVMFDFDPIHPF